MEIMQTLRGQSFGGERPLFGSHQLHLLDSSITDGESGLKNCQDLLLERCTFEGKYPLWHVDNFEVRDCLFKAGARAALWYSSRLIMSDTRVLASKMFREMQDLSLERVVLASKMFREMQDLSLERVVLVDAAEAFWSCNRIRLKEVSIEQGDYCFMYDEDLEIDGLKLHGNYAFQHVRHARINQAVIQTKDCFWETEDVVCENCLIESEYLGWHSRNLTLRNCRIRGTQPLCYAQNLTIDHCVFDEQCDLCFEDSTLEAVVDGPLLSIKNPRSGRIEAAGIGEVILDEYCLPPGDCLIVDRSRA